MWLALSTPEHPFHESAREYWRSESGERLAFCRTTMLGFLRLVTSEVVMGGQPLEAGEAWDAYLAWRRLDNVVFLDEPTGCDAVLSGWVQRGLVNERLWTDAYLAGFARAGRLRMVTFDQDFQRFDGVNLVQLVPT